MNKAMLASYGAVAAGSVAGALLRWGAGLAFTASLGQSAASATLFVNIVGSLAIGIFSARLRGPLARLFAMTGLCGGFTTFSALSLETLRFWQGDAIHAAAYAVFTIAVSVLACWLGEMIGKRT